MKHIKYKLKATWMILKADGFDVAATCPTKRGYFLWTTSVFGKDASANVIHNDIGNRFNHWSNAINKHNKLNEINQ